jgi:hypothetical protein
MQKVLSEDVRSAILSIIDYLWKDELADYLETSPQEGKEKHIFLALDIVKQWLMQPNATPRKK